jgi:hypothetical protein
VVNHAGPGLHYKHDKGDDARLVDGERRWSREKLFHIPERPTLVSFSGHEVSYEEGEHQRHRHRLFNVSSQQSPHPSPPAMSTATEALLSGLVHPLDQVLHLPLDDPAAASAAAAAQEDFVDVLVVSHPAVGKSPDIAVLRSLVAAAVAPLCHWLDDTSLVALVGFPRHAVLQPLLDASQQQQEQQEQQEHGDGRGGEATIAGWCGGDYSPILAALDGPAISANEGGDGNGDDDESLLGSLVLRRRSNHAHGAIAIEAHYRRELPPSPSSSSSPSKLSPPAYYTLVEFLDERFGMIQDLRKTNSREEG